MTKKWKTKHHKPQPNPIALALRTVRGLRGKVTPAKVYRRRDKHMNQEVA